MNKANVEQIKWVEVKSPAGKYHLFRRHISLAIGGGKDTDPWGGGHPFDLELTRVPAGKTNWPYHAHSAQWELYVILDGHGMARTPAGEIEIGPGDCFIHAPGEPHQIHNTGARDLVYYVIANNSQADVSLYPNSGKWFIKPQYKAFEMTEVDYYKGEE
ncbi:MAG: cupin domain-containing protein [Limisphaerales bacterium]